MFAWPNRRKVEAGSALVREQDFVHVMQRQSSGVQQVAHLRDPTSLLALECSHIAGKKNDDAEI